METISPTRIKEEGSTLLNDAYRPWIACCLGQDETKLVTKREFVYSYFTWALQLAPGALLLSLLPPRITYLAAFCETIASLTVWPKMDSEKFALSDHRRAHCIRDALSVAFLVAAYKHGCDTHFQNLPMVPIDLFSVYLSKYFSVKLNGVYSPSA